MNDVYFLLVILVYLILRVFGSEIIIWFRQFINNHDRFDNLPKQANPNDRNVFLYWVGDTPHLIALLRDLVYKHSNEGKSYKVHLINHDNIGVYIPETDLPSCFKELGAAHQADFVRVYCVAKYGGIWLDSDTLVMDDLQRLFDIMDEFEGFFVTEWGWICNGIFGSKPNTPFMQEWLAHITELLKEKNCQNIEWIELGGKYLTKARDDNKLSGYKILEGDKTIYPISPSDSISEYIEKPYDNYKIIERDFQPVVELVSAVYHKINEMVKSKDDIHNLNIPLNYFINKSFGR